MQSSASSSSASAPSDPLAALALLQQQHAAMQQQMQQQANVSQQQFAHFQQAAQAAAAAAGAQPAAPRLPKIAPPPKCKGASGAVDGWTTAMVQQFVYYGINDDASKLRMGAGNLEGDALLWYNALAVKPTSWDAFVEVLLKRFRPVNASLIARSRIAKLRQGPNHSVSAYASVFQSTLTAISDMNPADQVFNFVNGLIPALAGRVWQKQPVTLADAILEAATLEATLGFAGRAAGSSHFRPSASSSSSDSVPMV